MEDAEFEWDTEKAARNLADHGVAFEHAVKVFYDPSFIEYLDEREEYGEERINLLGFCDGVILHVTYTERGDKIRLISARRATRREQDYYYSQNAI